MRFRVNPRLLTEILSRGQYSQLKTVLAEYVANAWDADAKNVWITIPETPGEAITIEDDGEGIEMDAFSEVARDRQSHNRKVTKSGRPVLGHKGVGRWSGFAFTERLVFSTRRAGTETEIVLDKNEMAGKADLLEYEVVEVVRPTDKPDGTTVTLLPSQARFPVGVDSLRTDLLLDFSFSADFTICVNGVALTQQELPGMVKRLDMISEVFGPVQGFLHVTNTTRHKRPPGVIVRVKGRRVVGPAFFGAENEDFPKKVLDRILGDVNVDALEDAITSGREAFLEWDPRYQALETWLSQEICTAAASIQTEHSGDLLTEILSLPQVYERFRSLPEHLKATYRRAVVEVAPRLGRIRKDRPLLTLFALLLIRAMESSDFHRILVRLQDTDASDITELAKVLEQWGFGEISRAARMIQERYEVLEKFGAVVQNEEALELQHIHAALAMNTWILHDRYSLFSSNEQLRTIAKRLGVKYGGRHGQNRPDLILKRDRDDFLLIELKRPSESIQLTHVMQLLEYSTELRRMFPNLRDIDLYLVGRQFAEGVRDNFRPGNSQRVHLLSLNEIFNDAHDRLRWLLNEFAQERIAAEQALVEWADGDAPQTGLQTP